jgi:zinc protease
METEKSVSGITRADLIALHDKIFTTNNIIFSMAGDFNRDSMLVRLESMFPQAKAGATPCAFPLFDNASTVKGVFVNKKISQAYVRLGLPLFKRPDPDYYPVLVLDLILGGGGFTSRLGTKIRSDEGLTYSLYSYAESNYTYPATFYIDFYTRNETFVKALKLTLEEVKRLVKNGVTDKELANAKASLIGELPSMFRTPFDIVSTYAWNEYYGRSPDHFKKYAGELNAITKEDISKVAGKYLKPESFTYSIVGDSAALKPRIAADPELSKLTIKFIDPNMIPSLP